MRDVAVAVSILAALAAGSGLMAFGGMLLSNALWLLVFGRFVEAAIDGVAGLLIVCAGAKGMMLSGVIAARFPPSWRQ